LDSIWLTDLVDICGEGNEDSWFDKKLGVESELGEEY